MQGLVHFYYGDRLKAFEIGLGTIIRSKGHSIETITVIINDNYDWITNIKNNDHFHHRIFNKSEHKNCSLDFFTNLFSKENMTILIANIDLLLKSNVFQIEEFLELLVESDSRNEIILTSNDDFSEITNIANYVSFISSK